MSRYCHLRGSQYTNSQGPEHDEMKNGAAEADDESPEEALHEVDRMSTELL
jgi:hypothetical protein